MSYESFKAKVNALIRRSGQRVSVRFSTDEEKGKHYANCSDGTTIIGCPCSLKVTVKMGRLSSKYSDNLVGNPRRQSVIYLTTGGNFDII